MNDVQAGSSRPRSVRLDTIYPRLPKTEDGYYRCRYCGKVIPIKSGHYRGWCPGGECAHQAMIRVFPNMAASALHRREHGICRHCGLDTDALAAALRELQWRARGYHPPGTEEPPESEMNLWRDVRTFVMVQMRRRGFDVGHDWCEDRRLWACDHILEHAEGGTLQPDNLQTLCVPCHKAKTRRYVSGGQLDFNPLEPFSSVEAEPL